jgi:hypothetical protein
MESHYRPRKGAPVPSWQPNWTDVQFDYQGAHTAIADCYGCIAFMESRAHSLVPIRAQATREWRGRYREEFDAESSRLDRIAVDVIGQLRAAAQGIQVEIDAAEAEQRFRVAERARWESELRAEHIRDEQTRAEQDGATATTSEVAAPRSRGPGVIVLS